MGRSRAVGVARPLHRRTEARNANCNCRTGTASYRGAAGCRASHTCTTRAASRGAALTNSGGCYQPGEFCRSSDHGATGRTASGETIVCRYNNGWRWEPA